MLEYEWGNHSAVMMSGEEPAHEPDPNRPIFDHYHDHHSFADALYSHHNPPPSFSNPTHFHDSNQHHAPTHYPQLYDPRTYSTAGYSNSHHSLLSLDHISAAGGTPAGYFVVPKTEEVSRPLDFSSRIGLNLGGRTYFSSKEDDFVNRLYPRSMPDPGSVNAPRCQAEGCHADLSHSKHYHRRHKVCEFHSKASTVIANGLTQRFCQQCSRFHLLSEFDNGKRSCRKRLADHNRRRRKSQQQPAGSTNNLETPKSPNQNGRDSSSDNLVSRSPSDSGVLSSSSVTVAISPPRMSLDSFRPTSYHQGTASS